MLTAAQTGRIERLWDPGDWPEFADASYAHSGHRRPFGYYLRRLEHLGMPGGARLVDAGCGTGRWAFAFASRFDHVLGVDFTPARIATANWLKLRFRLANVDFQAGDVRRLPMEDGAVDALYSNSVMIGWAPLAVLLAETWRVLRPGGIAYVGLNGPGYAYYLATLSDAKAAANGRDRIYNDLCQSRLAPLVAALAPGGELNAKALALAGAGLSPCDALSRLGAREGEVEAARTIEQVLGETYAATLGEDIAAIARGARTGFSHATAGRGYEPEEFEATARSVGFGRFEWALDACLSLQADGSVRKVACEEAPGVPGEFEGRLRVYEALLWKPEGPPG